MTEPYEILGTDWKECLRAIIAGCISPATARMEVWLKRYRLDNDRLLESPEQLKYGWGEVTERSRRLDSPIATMTGRRIGTLAVWLAEDAAGDESTRLETTARWIAAAYEVQRRFESVRRVMRIVADSQDARAILNELLRAGIWLLRADRGDLTWQRRPGEVTSCQFGPSAVQVDRVPEQSITRMVMRDGQKRLIPDVGREASYFACHPDTKSEIAIPLLTRLRDAASAEQVGGVLNLEWFTNYPVNHEDAANLERLWDLVAPAVEAVHDRAALSDLVGHYRRNSGSEAELDDALARIESVQGFDSGVIWLVNASATHLECAWARTADYRGPRNDLRLPTTGGSFAARVYQDGEGECAGDDPCIDRAAYAALGVSGSVAGVRLESAGVILGVLTAWHSEGMEGHDRLARLKEMAGPAAARVSVFARRVTQRLAFERDLGQVLKTLQGRPDLGRIFPPILEQILKMGFHSARAFQYEEGERPGESCFRLISAIPRVTMKPIKPSENAWAAILVNDAMTAIARGVGAWPRPQVDSPDDPNPVTLDIGRIPGTPWIAIPLLVNGRLYGYIAADRSEKVTDEERDELALLGVLAAQALAPTQILSDQLQLMDHILHKALQPAGASNEELQLLIEQGDLDGLADRVTRDNISLKRIRRRAVQALMVLKQSSLEPEPFSLREAVEAAIEEFRAELPKSGCRVEFISNFDGSEEILGIKMEIESAIDNMLTNAYNACREGPIRVELTRDDGAMVVTVIDQGPGMTAEEFEDRRRIYRRGRGGRRTDRQTLGLGLGLYLLDQVANSYGGRLEIRSGKPFAVILRIQPTRGGTGFR